jgi:hypothetical protein
VVDTVEVLRTWREDELAPGRIRKLPLIVRMPGGGTGQSVRGDVSKRKYLFREDRV